MYKIYRMTKFNFFTIVSIFPDIRNTIIRSSDVYVDIKLNEKQTNEIRTHFGNILEVYSSVGVGS